MNSNGSKTKITEETQVSLRLTVSAICLAVLLSLGYADLRYQITSLRHTINDGMVDRWTATDDKAYMTLFAEANGLEAPKHTRVSEVDR
ncbi:MAG: hypothetical protein GY838_03730 [bacterium]|nr:hypothetical protein [bacterium]